MSSVPVIEPFYIHPAVVRSAAVAACFALLILAAPARGQAPSSLVVEADQIVFDQVAQTVDAEGQVRLRYRGIRLTADRVRFDILQEQLTAEGRVILVDAEGRELRGRRLRYDVRLRLAEVEQAQAIVERVYVRSEQLRAQPDRVVAERAMVTTCDPARPAYRITASRVEIVPGEQMVAHDATLWVGERRIITVPVYTVSLRTSEETAQSFPRAGYNHVDGLWVDYPLTYRLGPVEGLLYGKLGFRSGFIARNTLTYPRPGYAFSLTVGRNQNEDLLLYDLAEAALDVPSGPLALSVRTGWFREPSTGMETSRSTYELRFSTPTIALGPATTFTGTAAYQDAYYGTGMRYTVSRAHLTLARRLDEHSAVSLRYRRLVPSGATPFLFDAVPADDIVNTVGLQYGLTVPRGPEVTASYVAGVSYNFLDGTPSVNAGYGRRREGAYHWNLGAEYNLTTHAVKATTDSGAAIGPGTYVTVQAAYFVQTGQFEYLDLLLRSRLCDCFDLSFKYRSVHREIWLEIALAPDAPMAFPEEGPQP